MAFCHNSNAKKVYARGEMENVKILGGHGRDKKGDSKPQTLQHPLLTNFE